MQEEKLPVTAGFILPNQEVLNAAGIGHSKVARDYLNKNKLYDRFVQSEICAEDDFLMKYLGAIKVAVYRGLGYIYIPRIHGWYLNEISKLYIDRGFKPLYMDTEYSCEENRNDYCYGEYNYNRTVVEFVKSDGKIALMYNPIRKGD